MANSVPEAIEASIVAILFREAQALNWDSLSDIKRSLAYRRWLSDPNVGGVLTRFMTVEEARLWIKDGQMKEYSRAINGLGKHADLVTDKRPGPEELVRRTLGSTWAVAPASQQIKPLRVQATDGTETITFAWGNARDYKHLVWAALQGGSTGDRQRWILCTVSPFVDPVPKDVVARNEDIAKRCALTVFHLTV